MVMHRAASNHLLFWGPPLVKLAPPVLSTPITSHLLWGQTCGGVNLRRGCVSHAVAGEWLQELSVFNYFHWEFLPAADSKECLQTIFKSVNGACALWWWARTCGSQNIFNRLDGNIKATEFSKKVFTCVWKIYTHCIMVMFSWGHLLE